jgi:hypothetical protein
MYFIEHPLLIFLFFTIPFFGWVLYKTLNRKIVLFILCSAVILLLPVFTGYKYVIDNVYTILFYIIFTCCYSFLIIRFKKPLGSIITHSVVLIFVFGIISFYSGFFGTIQVKSEWNMKKFKIQYLREQGFSGGPQMEYELYHYGSIPIFIKHVEEKIDSDTTNNCIVKFKYQNVRFDKCDAPEN